jgi:hypothetical protein
MRQQRKKFEGVFTFAVILLAVFGSFLISCEDDNTSKSVDSSLLNLSGIAVPSSITTNRGAEIAITGKGFQIGDTIIIESISNNDTSYSTPVIAVTEISASFLLPGEMTSGTYKLIVSREDEQLTLGTTLINITVNTDIPDIEGMTVKGVIYSDGEGVPGVVVSDGYEVTITNYQKSSKNILYHL